MTYKSKDKSFFENVVENEVVEAVQDKKDELERKGKKKFLKMYDFGASKLRDEIRRRPAQYFFLFITSFLGSVITTGAALIIFSGNLVAQFVPKPEMQVKSIQATGIPDASKIKKYDPLLLASKIRKKESDFELVDIRSISDYISGHIVNSINIPVYETSMVKKNGDLDADAIKQTFKQYMSTDKVLIIYAQNAYSTIPNDIASILNSPAKSVKVLATGWDEWKYLNK